MSDRPRAETACPRYCCPTCLEDLPPGEARLTITCAKHVVEGAHYEFAAREARAEDRRAVEEICEQARGETEVDTLGATFDVLSSDNIVAVDGKGRLTGLVSTRAHEGEEALVLLAVHAGLRGRGIGTALVEAAVERAEERGMPFMRVGVSNDDIPSLYFYQRLGFFLTEVAAGALSDPTGSVDEGFAGIPVRDEIRLRRPLTPRRRP